MNPISFKESNRILNKPASMTDEECSSLPVYNDGSLSVSCWRGSIIDRLRFLLTGKIWLGVLSGHTQPPVWIDTSYPFQTPEEK